MNSDLPHERDQVARQLAKHPLTGNLTMGGFVQAYADLAKEIPTKNVNRWDFLFLIG